MRFAVLIGLTSFMSKHKCFRRENQMLWMKTQLVYKSSATKLTKVGLHVKLINIK